MNYLYPYTSERQSDGTYLVQFLDFKEGVTEGRTPAEAAKFADEVLDLILAAYLDDGKALPIPSEVGSHPFSVAALEGCQSRSWKVGH
jgi:predicted RNase H-like HicB family nuclease